MCETQTGTRSWMWAPSILAFAPPHSLPVSVVPIISASVAEFLGSSMDNGVLIESVHRRHSGAWVPVGATLMWRWAERASLEKKRAGLGREGEVKPGVAARPGAGRRLARPPAHRQVP